MRKYRRHGLLCVLVCFLQCRDIELHHLHHGSHHRLDFLRVGVTDELHESPRHDLPRDAELIGNPAALRWSRAGTDQPVPVRVHLSLVFAVDKKREPLREFEVGAAVVTHKGLTADDEFGRSDWAILARAGNILDLRIWERSGVEVHGSFELIVEHQEGCYFGRGCASFVWVIA